MAPIMESDQSAALLGQILETLKKIQGGLEVQDKKIALLEQKLGGDGGPEERLTATEDRKKLNTSNAQFTQTWNSSHYDGDDDLTIFVPPSVRCRRIGCEAIYTGWDRLAGEAPCVYHPGPEHYVREEFNFLYGCCKAMSNNVREDQRGCQTKSHHCFLSIHGSIASLPVDTMVPFPLQSTLPPLAGQSRSNSLNSSNASIGGRSFRSSSWDAVTLGTLQHGTAWLLETTAEKIETVSYLDWHSPVAASPLHQNECVREHLGGIWIIPEDGRVPLRFSRQILEKLTPSLVVERCRDIAAFAAQITKGKGCDFRIIDDCTLANGVPTCAIYRFGKTPKFKGSCVVPLRSELSPVQSSETPWRRFIFCQGLNTVSEYKANGVGGALSFVEKPADGTRPFGHVYAALYKHFHYSWPIEPFFSRNHGLGTFGHNFNSLNIYFFEILSPESGGTARGLWRSGPLYHGRPNVSLCQSLFTLVEIPGDKAKVEGYLRREDEMFPLKAVNDWTVILLTPPHFMPSYWRPSSSLTKSLHGICLEFLSKCFAKLNQRWESLRQHLDTILDEESTILFPERHDELLWDDESFTRSRTYFWAINALAQFHKTLTENLNQWEAYYDARIKPFQEAELLTETDLKHLRGIESHISGLQSILLHFAEQRESTKSLRDGLFNASAVVETRASTRLGENVKLLTMVSIFFLPLAFCTSLWSMNDMWSSTILIYTIIIVGLSTYFVVANLNNIVTQGSRIYRPIRRYLIAQMQKSRTKYKWEWGFWVRKGDEFNVFMPRHEKTHPSEWWVFLFVFVSIWRRIFGASKKAKDETESSKDTLGSSDTSSPYSSRRSSVSLDEGSSVSVGEGGPQEAEAMNDTTISGNGVPAEEVQNTDPTSDEILLVQPHPKNSNGPSQTHAQDDDLAPEISGDDEIKMESKILVKDESAKPATKKQKSSISSTSSPPLEVTRESRTATQRLSRLFRRNKHSSFAGEEREVV